MASSQGKENKLPKLLDQIEFSKVREKTLNLSLKSERISALLAEREIFYEDEAKAGTKQPNQDAIVISQPGGSWHVGIADGVGGLPAGEVASTQALRFVHRGLSRLLVPEFFQRYKPIEVRVALEALLLRASRHIRQLQCNEEKRSATTVVGVFPLSHDRVVVYSVGDSVAALVPRNPLRPILYTTNHSTYENLVLDGQASRRELLEGDGFQAEDGKTVQDMLTSAVGGSSVGPRSCFVSILEVKPGDHLFLFSDGLLKTTGRFHAKPKRPNDLRRFEYGRADRLLQFLSSKATALSVLADRDFRVQQGGPERLIDDTAVVRIELRHGEEHGWPDHDSRIIRPKSRAMPEITEDTLDYRFPVEDDTVSITINP